MVEVQGMRKKEGMKRSPASSDFDSSLAAERPLSETSANLSALTPTGRGPLSRVARWTSALSLSRRPGEARCAVGATIDRPTATGSLTTGTRASGALRPPVLRTAARPQDSISWQTCRRCSAPAQQCRGHRGLGKALSLPDQPGANREGSRGQSPIVSSEIRDRANGVPHETKPARKDKSEGVSRGSERRCGLRRFCAGPAGERSGARQCCGKATRFSSIPTVCESKPLRVLG